MRWPLSYRLYDMGIKVISFKIIAKIFVSQLTVRPFFNYSLYFELKYFLIYICRFDDQRRLNTSAPKSLKTESRLALVWKYKIAESSLLTQQERVVYLPDDLSYEIVSDVLIAVINIYSHFYCAHSRVLMGFWKFLRSEIFIRVRSG